MKDFCFPCHNDEIASRSRCQYCHIYQEAMLLGDAGEGMPIGDVSVHQKALLSCVDCHTDGCVPNPVQACLDCHSESIVSRQEEEKAWIERSMKILEKNIPRLAERINKAEDMGRDISQINGIYTLVQDVYAFLNADKSNGAHNPSYSRYLLDDTINKLDYALLVVNQLQRVAF